MSKRWGWSRYRCGPYHRTDLRARLVRTLERPMPYGVWEIWNRYRAAVLFRTRPRNVPKPFLVASSAWITRRDIKRGEELAKEHGW